MPVMGNMAVVAQGLTWQLPKTYAAVQGAQQQPTPDEDGVEGGGGGGEGEEEEGVEGGGDGGGGDLLLLQMYRHYKPPSFLRWLLGHKETFKKMPFDWKANWVKLSFGHLKMKKNHSLHLKTHRAELALCLHQSIPNKLEDLGV